MEFTPEIHLTVVFMGTSNILLHKENILRINPNNSSVKKISKSVRLLIKIICNRKD